ncbi:MAG TPA: hypothetical protein VE988_21420, partial [Gemmataceae bacterium]|nr:hypothetical protein [Gemmataceae bacterium]
MLKTLYYSKSVSFLLVLAASVAGVMAFVPRPGLPQSDADGSLALQKVPEKKEPPNQAEIKKLIELLGAREFKAREAAMARLNEIGLPALDALQDAEENAASLEIRQRAGLLIAPIRKANRLPTRI